MSCATFFVILLDVLTRNIAMHFYANVGTLNIFYVHCACYELKLRTGVSLIGVYKSSI